MSLVTSAATGFGGKELVNGGEDDAAARDLEQLPQMFAAVRLLRFLSQQLATTRERAEQLVVQIIPVGEHDERRVFHRWMHDKPPGIERHRQRLARTLGV